MGYVRNAWYVASWVQDLEDEKPFAITILDEAIVIFRSASGRLTALEDRCVHRLAPLSDKSPHGGMQARREADASRG